MKYFLLIFLIGFSFNIYSAENFYDLTAIKINGDTLRFSELKGKRIMFVNVASKCGYTPQYKDLQTLYSQYGGDKFEIIGFPANNFNNQEPGSDEDIEDFCTEKYGVTFTMMSKISVVGSNMHPVYQWLTKKEKNGVVDQEVLWNFQKYLVDEKGQLVGIYGSQDNPLKKEIVDWVKNYSDINDEIIPMNLDIYPNPTDNFIYITLPDVNGIKFEDQELYIFNSNYELIYSEKINLESKNNVKIDVSKLNSGVYFLKCATFSKFFVKVR